MTESLDVINHIRLVSLAEFHAGLNRLRQTQAGHYLIITNWLMSLKPTTQDIPKPNDK